MEIKNCYPVPHNESGGGQARVCVRAAAPCLNCHPRAQVLLDIEYHKSMLELHLRVSPKDVLVGWFSTGAGLVPADALFHEFYAAQCPQPLHLAFDTAFVDPTRAVRCWVGSNVSLRDTVVATSFVELPLAHAAAEAQRTGLQLLTATTPVALGADAGSVSASVRRLGELLRLAADYAQSVADGKLPPDAELGRLLADAVAAVPRLPRAQFDSLFNESVQDVLLTMYLSALTKTHTMLNAKLSL